MTQPTTPFDKPAAPLTEHHQSTLILLASRDESLGRELDIFSGGVANQLDLRSGAAWLHVDHPEAFVAKLAAHFPPSCYSDIRIAFVDAKATVDRLVQSALIAPSLRQHLDAKADEAFRVNPPMFQTHYQPISRLGTGEVIGFEALLRARHGSALIDTEDVFRRAERGGWLGELDQLARVLAIKSLGGWLNGGLIFLNLAAPNGEFDLKAINATIDAAVSAGLEPDQLVLEAVEHNRYSDLEAASAQIQEVRERGVRVAIDDVGDGFASLRVLTSFKPDIVKISGNLTNDIRNPLVKEVVSTIVDLAHRTNAWVVAEGIEDPHQASILTSLGCDWGQGVLLGSPDTAPVDA